MTLFEALKFAKEQTQSDFVAREILKFSQNLSDERLILNFQSKIDDFDKFKSDRYIDTIWLSNPGQLLMFTHHGSVELKD